MHFLGKGWKGEDHRIKAVMGFESNCFPFKMLEFSSLQRLRERKGVEGSWSQTRRLLWEIVGWGSFSGVSTLLRLSPSFACLDMTQFFILCTLKSGMAPLLGGTHRLPVTGSFLSTDIIFLSLHKQLVLKKLIWSKYHHKVSNLYWAEMYEKYRCNILINILTSFFHMHSYNQRNTNYVYLWAWYSQAHFEKVLKDIYHLSKITKAFSIVWETSIYQLRCINNIN